MKADWFISFSNYLDYDMVKINSVLISMYNWQAMWRRQCFWKTTGGGSECVLPVSVEQPGPWAHAVVEPELGQSCAYDAHYPFSAHCLLIGDTPGVKQCLGSERRE